MDNIITVFDKSDFTNLSHNCTFEYRCVNCGNIHRITRFRRGRVHRYETMLCENCYREKQSFDKYGTKNPMQSHICLDKQAATNYAVYGTRSALQNPSVKSKTIATNRNKHGVDYYVESIEFKEKAADTKTLLYGSSTYSNPDKRKETLIELYGVDNPMKVESFKAKSIETCRKVREENPMRFQSKKWYYDFNSFDTFSELAVYVYCKFFGIPIYRNYSIGIEYCDVYGGYHKTYPDFILNGTFCELKGCNDFDGTDLIFTYKRHRLSNGVLVEYTEEELVAKQKTLKNKQDAMNRAGVVIIPETSDWVKMCIKFTENILPKLELFNKSNINNIRFGYTPYNYNVNNVYQTPIGLGSTPQCSAYLV